MILLTVVVVGLLAVILYCALNLVRCDICDSSCCKGDCLPQLPQATPTPEATPENVPTPEVKKTKKSTKKATKKVTKKKKGT